MAEDKPEVKPRRLTNAEIDALIKEGDELRRIIAERLRPMTQLTYEDLHRRVR